MQKRGLTKRHHYVLLRRFLRRFPSLEQVEGVRALQRRLPEADSGSPLFSPLLTL